MENKQIHIVNGESAGGTLVSALGCRPDLILVNHDALSAGPLTPVESLEEWRNLRQTFWEGLYAGFEGGVPDYESDLLRQADVLRNCEAITVWVGSGATEQLLLPYVVHLFSLLNTPICDMSVVQIERLAPPRNSIILGIGEVSPELLRAHAHPVQISQDDIAELRGFWFALTATRPEELLKSMCRDATGFPLLRRALRTTLDRYPDRCTGLSHWDKELLSAVRTYGPTAVNVIGHVIGDSCQTNYPDSVGDLQLFDRMRQLGDQQLVRSPLVMKGDLSSYRACEAWLTAAGEDFLEGRKNLVEINGIDEWVAGVHLDSSAGDVWFRDGDTLVAESNA